LSTRPRPSTTNHPTPPSSLLAHPGTPSDGSSPDNAKMGNADPHALDPSPGTTAKAATPNQRSNFMASFVPSALHVHIVGVTILIVEMDAQYVKGILNNPDMQPNAAMNQWIAAIRLFDFKLVHVSADKHQGPDDLSRCEPILGEDDEEDHPEDWFDDHQCMQGFRIQALKTLIFEVPAGVPPPTPTPTATTTIAQQQTPPLTTYPLNTSILPSPPTTLNAYTTRLDSRHNHRPQAHLPDTPTDLASTIDNIATNRTDNRTLFTTAAIFQSLVSTLRSL